MVARQNARRKESSAGMRGVGMCLAVATIALALTLAFASPAAADVSVSAPNFNGIVVDGFADDWTNIPGVTLTLIRPLATAQRLVDGLTVKVAHDDANVYVLASIKDDFDYNATDHERSGSIAVLWQIDPAATPDMGGGLGNVDIWHWELDTGPGVPVGGPNYTGGNDPVGNFDDEWASDVATRFDDAGANELYGVWSHTNLSGPSAPGTWIFEMRRSLTTSDTLRQDRQFAVNQPVGMAVAYWDPDETASGWTPSGHYASCKDPATLDFSWIQVTLVPVVVPQGPAGPAGPAGSTGPTGATGPQGEQGVAGTVEAAAVASSYGGLALGIAALAISVVALVRSRKGRAP